MKVTIATTLLKNEVEQVRSNLEFAQERAGIDTEISLGINQEGEGYVAGINKALENIDGGYVCLLNSDSNPLTNNWLKVLITEMERREKFKVWFAGPSGGCRTAPQNQGRLGDKRRPRFVRHVSGFCMLVHPDVLTMGPLDNTYHHYAGEIDWQWESMSKHDCRAIWVPEVFVSHEVHNPNQEWWKRDHEIFNKKWRSKQ